jgi:large subunit ribosomal protein L13
MEYTLDAQGKSVGRVATEAAMKLMGKNTPAYKPNVAPDVSVRIVNAAQANISEKKKDEKTYERYSGYPGGLKSSTMGEVIAKKGYAEVFRMAVKGMLPKNKLQAVMMKHLTVEE